MSAGDPAGDRPPDGTPAGQPHGTPAGPPAGQPHGTPAGPPAGPYTPARRVGAWVVTSGQIGTVPGPSGGPRLVEGGTVAELRRALENLATVLSGQGATLADVVKTTVFLVDMEDYADVNAIWMEVFASPRPARSAVAVAALPLGARVEVEAWAHLPGNRPPGAGPS